MALDVGERPVAPKAPRYPFGVAVFTPGAHLGTAGYGIPRSFGPLNLAHQYPLGGRVAKPRRFVAHYGGEQGLFGRAWAIFKSVGFLYSFYHRLELATPASSVDGSERGENLPLGGTVKNRWRILPAPKPVFIAVFELARGATLLIHRFSLFVGISSRASCADRLTTRGFRPRREAIRWLRG